VTVRAGKVKKKQLFVMYIVNE